MNTVATAAESAKKRYAGQRLSKHDFSGQELHHADFRGATLIECDFTGADLSLANFEGANCWGSCFQDARLFRTNFKDAILSNTNLRAKNCFGITFTLDCNTFDEMKVGNSMWWAWLMFASMTIPNDPAMTAQLVALIGPDRYTEYMAHFRNREL